MANRLLVETNSNGVEDLPRNDENTIVSQTPGARLVVDGGTAVGAATGHVLVQHQRSLNDTGTALSLVSLDTGQVAGSLDVESQVERAVVGQDGTAAVATRDVLAVVHGDGRVVRVDIGATDFFGSPQ